MSIITNNDGNVKTAQTAKQQSEKWREKKLEAIAFSERMYRYPSLRARAQRMRNCGDIVLMQKCPKCGKEHIYGGMLCGDRLCPVCGWRLSISRYAQMLACLDLLAQDMIMNDIQCSMLTLTLRNCPIDKLHDTLVSMSRAWHNLSRQASFKRSVYAWARTIEITYNAKAKTYHPHMHILLFAYGSSLAEDVAFTRKAVRAWKESLGLDYEPIYDHKTAYANDKTLATYEEQETISFRNQTAIAARAAAVEVSKYIMGDKMGYKIPTRDILEYAEAIKGVHMVGYGGALKTARAALGLIDDQIDSTTVHTECTSCGAALQNYILKWSGAGYLEIPMDE